MVGYLEGVRNGGLPGRSEEWWVTWKELGMVGYMEGVGNGGLTGRNEEWWVTWKE